MNYNFKTNFLKNDNIVSGDEIEEEDINFLSDIAIRAIDLIYKVNPFDSQNIRAIKNQTVIDSINGDVYSILLSLKYKGSRKNDFAHFKFIFKLDKDNNFHIIDTSLFSSKDDYKIEIFKVNNTLLDNIKIMLNNNYEIIEYKIEFGVEFKVDTFLFLKYKVNENGIKSELEYNGISRSTSSINNHFKLENQSVNIKEIYRDLTFLILLLKLKYTKYSYSNIFEYINFEDIDIAENLKTAYILFKNEKANELKDKMTLLQMITI